MEVILRHPESTNACQADISRPSGTKNILDNAEAQRSLVNKTVDTDNHVDLANDAPSESFLTRAANVMTCLSEGNYTLTDIAERCNISASTAHRLLSALTEPGFVIYDAANHRYYLGTRVVQLSSNPVTSHQYLIMATNHEMQHLAKVSDETVTLSLMLGTRYLPLNSVQSRQRLLVLDEYHGNRPVIPRGSTDLTLLSQLREKELKLALKIGQKWLGPRDKTIRDIASWEARLVQIREAGYAVTRGEKVPGGTGISAPVANYFCPVALTIIGPEYRLEPRLPDLIHKLTLSGRRISRIVADLFS